MFAGGKPVFVSGIGGLIQRMEAAGRDLDGDLSEHRDLLAETGYLEATRHGIDELEAAVVTRLLASRGETLLGGAQGVVTSVLLQHARKLELERAHLEDLAGVNSKSLGELEQELKQAKARQAAVERLVNDVDGKQDEVKQRLVGEAFVKFEAVGARLAQEIERALGTVQSTSRLTSEAAWIFKTNFDAEIPKLVEAANQAREEAQKQIQELGDEIEKICLSVDARFGDPPIQWTLPEAWYATRSDP